MKNKSCIILFTIISIICLCASMAACQPANHTPGGGTGGGSNNLETCNHEYILHRQHARSKDTQLTHVVNADILIRTIILLVNIWVLAHV